MGTSLNCLRIQIDDDTIVIGFGALVSINIVNNYKLHNDGKANMVPEASNFVPFPMGKTNHASARKLLSNHKSLCEVQEPYIYPTHPNPIFCRGLGFPSILQIYRVWVPIGYLN